MSLQNQNFSLSQPPRVRILDAAARLFVDHGFHATRLTEVAKLADVSRSTIYDLFASKDALLIAINDELIADSMAMEREMLGEDQPDVALANWFRAIFLADDAYKNRLKIVFSDDAQRGLLLNRAAIEKSVVEANKLVRKILRKGVKAGVFHSDIHIAKSAKHLQSLHYFFTRQVVTQHPIVELNEQDVEDMITIALNALLKNRKY